VDLTFQVTDSSSPNQHDQAVLSLRIEPDAISPSVPLVAATVYNYSGVSYDGVGNLLGYTDAAYTNGVYTDSVMGAWSFQYDTLNRLATGGVTWPDGTPQSFCWQYDSFGNRQQQEISSAAFQSGSGGANACSAQSNASLATDLASYNGNNQIASTNARGVTYSPAYDPSGNVTSDGANYYLYDAEGRICAVQSAPMLGMTTYTGYLYDADGTRVAKGTITSMSCDPTTNGFQFTENYVLGPGGEELSMLDGNNNWQRTNAYAAGKLIGTYDMASNGQGAQVAALHFHLEDPLGTRRMQLNGNLATLGQPETDIQSLPFGDQLNPYPDQYAAASDDSTPLHFTGKERDAESGNDYFGARYYASAMGRFMSPDPMSPMSKGKGAAFMDYIGQPQNWNKYAYARNDPNVLFDPDGKETQVAIGGRVSDNVFGHAWIIINGKAYSYGTNDTHGPKGQKDWGVDAKAMLQGEAAKGRSTDLLTLNVTPAQEQALQTQLDSNNPNAPGAAPYSIPGGNSCVDQVQNPLIDTGILQTQPMQVDPTLGAPIVPINSPAITPSGLESELQSQPGLVQSTQTVGQSNTGFFQSLWNTIKHAF
jgi:RHS repeat-associated protein